MLNQNIKIDLHIHSYASRYKESNGIVEHSKKENLSTLFEGLEKENVSMISFTDHNRFDTELYLEANNIQRSNTYPTVKSVLAGVEFDVLLESDHPACHIVTIFNAIKLPDDYQKIEDILSENLLQDPKSSYAKEDFEKIIRQIGLDVILIAHQRHDEHISQPSSRSLSDATNEPGDYLKIGYINALEFQKMKVEGIIRANMKENHLIPPALLSGSDCHEWDVYPRHDKGALLTPPLSTIQALPTFKGLLMAITSPTTRFNRGKKIEHESYNSLTINANEISLSSGINAIIGENGSGKSTLIKLINHKDSEGYIRNILSKNAILCPGNIPEEKTKYISQTELTSRSQTGDCQLFTNQDSVFKDVDITDFEFVYNKFQNDLFGRIQSNIERTAALEKATKKEISIEPLNNDFHFVQASKSPFNRRLDSEFDQHIITLKQILRLVEQELEAPVYEDSQKAVLFEVSNMISAIFSNLQFKSSALQVVEYAQNIINQAIGDYLLDISAQQTSQDQSSQRVNQNIDEFTRAILDSTKANCTLFQPVKLPEKQNGEKRNVAGGLIFVKKAAFHEEDLIVNFLKEIFVKEYRDLTKISEISNLSDFSKAVLGLSSTSTISEIKEKWDMNFRNFLNKAKKITYYILDGQSNRETGNTPGEQAMNYFKYLMGNGGAWDILLLDQPEDSISNTRISNELINLFNKIRKDGKQVILVTHNPLLVVNLDVDNVIFLELKNGTLAATSGCLEDEDNDILGIVSSIMDGGKEEIEKRLKLYE